VKSDSLKVRWNTVWEAKPLSVGAGVGTHFIHTIVKGTIPYERSDYEAEILKIFVTGVICSQTVTDVPMMV